MKIILLASTALITTTLLATADEGSFSGGYAGVQTGVTISNTKLSVTNERAVNILNSGSASTKTNKNSTGLLYGAYGGYGLTLNNFYVGGEASIMGDTTKRSMNQSASAAGGSYNATSNFKRGIAFGIAPRFGYVFGDNMVYVKPGIEISKDKATATYSFNGGANTTVSARKTNVALTPAAGFERAVGKVLFRGEYTYDRGKKMGINGGAPVAEVANISYTDHRFAIGAAYKF